MTRVYDLREVVYTCHNSTLIIALSLHTTVIYEQRSCGKLRKQQAKEILLIWKQLLECLASWLYECAALGKTATCRISDLANSLQNAHQNKWPNTFHILTFAIDWQSHLSSLNCSEMQKIVCYQPQIVAQG